MIKGSVCSFISKLIHLKVLFFTPIGTPLLGRGWGRLSILQCIQHLLFDLFELVFHFHDDVLHFSMVAL